MYKPKEKEMSDTAMAHAFENAYSQIANKLRDIAVDALAKETKLIRQQDYVANKLRGELSWELFRQWDEPASFEAIRFLLDRTAKENTGVKPVGGGQWCGDVPVKSAPAASNTNGKPHAVKPGPGHLPSNNHSESARSSTLTELALKQRNRMSVRAAVEVRLSRLDTFKIYGKAIGDCRVSEVREWAEKRTNEMREAGRDARFALNLIANLPSGEIVRNWWPDDLAVERIYTNAEADYNAA